MLRRQFCGYRNTIRKSGELYIWYNNEWQTTFINAQHLKGINYLLQVYDLTGRNILKEEGKPCNFCRAFLLLSLIKPSCV